MVIDLSPTRLDDVDIFTADGFIDFYSGFTDGKFGKKSISGWYTKVITDVCIELRM